jgi:tRNA pseudouridine55 synthase
MGGTAEAGADGIGSILLLDKPSGPTSHDAVDRVRRCEGTRSVGHTGTLDPFATGLLVLCVGGATRLAEYFHLPDKRYRATLRLGIETGTHDPEGEVTRRSDAWKEVGPDDLRAALQAHTGRIRQTPPAYSAKRVDGERAHRAARSGREVELEPEEVTVASLELLAFEPPEARIEAAVSTGTYVRALARDLGRHLGCGAHLAALRRTAVGPLCVEDALAWEALEPGAASADGAGPARAGAPGRLAPAEALSWLPRRELSAQEAGRVRHGGRIPRGDVDRPRDRLRAPPEDLPVLLLREGRLLAVAEVAEDELQPRKVWPDAA